ncbi:hypothetical protein [Morganella morganii]|uniref:hypothetical protein n=1 Tax=Morganella morganii TaxID=582 RepID=UPI000BFC0631|nr:hypothetical protein [Morganella morganii]PHH07152.1 hypothetical protein CRX48_22280 [Morganella morganii]
MTENHAKDNTNGIGFSVEGGKHTAGSYFIDLMYWILLPRRKNAYVLAVNESEADAAESVKGEIGTTSVRRLSLKAVSD